MAKKKYYVVWKGVEPGIYESWKECERQVRGFEGAVYKSFEDLETARKAYGSHPSEYYGKPSPKPTLTPEQRRKIGTPILESICVDAACSGNPGVLEYRGVDLIARKEIFHQGPFPQGTVNIGEFLAIVHALAYLKRINSTLPVYSDSRTAIKWLKDKAIKTKLERNKKNAGLFDLVDRALKWLRENDYPNRVMKWETEYWGEIPADFGRK
jgi:ribonuclease HI